MLSKFIPCLLLVMLISAMPVLFVSQANAAILTVSVQTNKAVYNQGESVIIRVYVVKFGVPVVGATVFVSVEPPGGGVASFPAGPIGGPGWYGYTSNLSPSAGGGVYKVGAHATKGGDSGSAQTTFSVIGGPSKSVDWAVFNPSTSPANPTTADPVKNSVGLQIVATVSPGPYPVDIICTVDGVLVGGDTIAMSGMGSTMVYTDPRKYPAGTHTVIWVVDPDHKYIDGNLGNNQVSFQFTVTPPAPAFDFSLTASSTSQTIKAGQNTGYSITATLTSGSPKTIKLSVEGIPTGASHTLSTISGIPTFSANLAVQTSKFTPLGTHTLTIRGEGVGVTKTITVALTIESPVEPDFEISAVPTSQAITPPQSTSYVITITGKGDFKSKVGLTISGVPAGIQASFEPSSDEPDYTSTLSLTATQTVPANTYALTIYASGGGKTKSTVVNLVVREVPTPMPTTTTAPVIGPSSIVEMLTGYGYLIVVMILVFVIAALVTALILRGRR